MRAVEREKMEKRKKGLILSHSLFPSKRDEGTKGSKPPFLYESREHTSALHAHNNIYFLTRLLLLAYLSAESLKRNGQRGGKKAHFCGPWGKEKSENIKRNNQEKKQKKKKKKKENEKKKRTKEKR